MVKGTVLDKYGTKKVKRIKISLKKKKKITYLLFDPWSGKIPHAAEQLRNDY